MPSIAHSQTLSPFQRGVPAGTATAGPVSLTLADAVRRALEHNLGVILTEQRVDEAGGARWRALSELLPNANARLAATRQQVNLKAFGFPLPAGFPSVVGPFNVYDARVYLTQSLIDLHAMKIGEQVKKESLRQCIPQPRTAEVERDGPEIAAQDCEQIGAPALHPSQVSLLGICRSGHERARGWHVFVYASLVAVAVTQRQRECRNPV